MSLNTHNECLWQNRDILLYLCCFIEGQELVLFATSCRFIYQIIVDRPGYWEGRYRRTFCLGDRREQEWLTWYNWHINATTELRARTFNVNQTKHENLLLSTTTNSGHANSEHTPSINSLLFDNNFDITQWFYAYNRRRQTNCNFMSGRFKKRMCQLPVTKFTYLKIVDVNPWHGLVWDENASKIWSIRHDIFSKTNKCSNKELDWKELTIPLSSSLFNGRALINAVYGAYRFVVGSISLSTYIDVKPIFFGEQILNMDELEARYIRESKIDLLDLDGKQWIKGPRLPKYDSRICIQFVSRKQCQFLSWAIVHGSEESNTSSTTATIPNGQVFDRDNQTMRIKWKLFDVQKGQSQCRKILSNEIIGPYYSNAIIKTEMYTEKMCLINVFKAGYIPSINSDKTFDVWLSLFAFGKFSANTSSQSIFDVRDYGRSQPIDSCDQGRILWSRYISSNRIEHLYSEKLIIIQHYDKFDVLDARDGSLLHSIACPYYSTIIPFLGSLCSVLYGTHRKSWLIDLYTKYIYKPPARLIGRKAEKEKYTGAIKTTNLASLNEYVKSMLPQYRVSNVVIGQINAESSGLYEAYMF
ncbi:hypothetical protein BDF19DRAFT_425512 [Syncephalis fuscata]|nr:hypothetical protein BDF19DRAFT_425512 [Syncephalis fuscata]